MKQKEGFVLRQVCGEHVIVAEGLGVIDFGKLLSLNETAAWLWQEAERQGSFTEQSLAEALCQEYDVSKEDALRDVTELIANWKESGVIEL